MRVAITGASGNVGTSLLQALASGPNVDSILGLARRPPAMAFPKTTWTHADVASSDLVPLFRGCDAVVHLAWRIQPSRNLGLLESVNVSGSRRVFEAVADAEVPALVYASSVGAYSEGPKDRAVDESWPTDGVASSYYGRQKAAVERILDTFEQRAPQVRVVRLRPGLIFKSQAASEIRRLFLGPFLPSPLVRRELIPIFPVVPGLRFQCVHSHDVGEAYALAVTGDACGAFNLAADPVVDLDTIAHLLDARPVRVPAGALRAAADMTWRLHLQPASAGWLDLALGVPIMDTNQARGDLGWTPRASAEDALVELLEGLRRRDGMETPPLRRAAGGLLRSRELRSGVGGTEAPG